MLLWAPFGSIIFPGYEAFFAKRAEYFGVKEKLVTLSNYFVIFFSKTHDKSPFFEMSGYVWTGRLSGSVVTNFILTGCDCIVLPLNLIDILKSEKQTNRVLENYFL